MEINYDLSEQVCINYCYFIHVKVNVMILYGLEEFENEFWFIIIFYMILLNWLMVILKLKVCLALFFYKTWCCLLWSVTIDNLG